MNNVLGQVIDIMTDSNNAINATLKNLMKMINILDKRVKVLEAKQ